MANKNSTKCIYKIQFSAGKKIYELYAREISQSNMHMFIEVADIIFGERAKLVVDPSEEQLKNEFSQVQRTYIPVHSVLRIDQVAAAGINKIVDNTGDAETSNIAKFPTPPA